jgi:hypothetical protein
VELLKDHNIPQDRTMNFFHAARLAAEDGGKSWELNWIAVDTRVK